MRIEEDIQMHLPELEVLLTSENIKETLCGNLILLSEEIEKGLHKK